MPLAHAGLALGLLVGSLFLGGHLLPGLLDWPFYLLAPLIAYVLLVGAVAPLRRSLHWARVGDLEYRVWAAAAVIVMVSSAALVIWNWVVRPDVSLILARIPMGSLATLLLCGAAFSVVNALLEEILFRGLLFDALKASYGVAFALFLQAGAFGVFHFQGFPSGAIGVALAAIFGLMQGMLRIYSGGLFACWVSHALVDGTIFALLVRRTM
jgi:hypothetical protein